MRISEENSYQKESRLLPPAEKKKDYWNQFAQIEREAWIVVKGLQINEIMDCQTMDNAAGS